MNEIIRFIEDANEAFCLFSNYIKEEIAEDTNSVNTGNEEKEKQYENIANMKICCEYEGENENILITLNEKFRRVGLMQQYIFLPDANEKVLIDFVNRIDSEFQNAFLQCQNKDQRGYLIKRIIRGSIDLITAESNVFRNAISFSSILTSEGYAYENEDMANNVTTTPYGEDALGVIKAAKITNLLLISFKYIFHQLENECTIADINLLDTIQKTINLQGHTELINRELFSFTDTNNEVENIQSGVPGIDNNSKNEFTLRRKIEAIKAMLEEFGIERGGNSGVPDVNIARFINFLIGKGTKDDEIKNTSIYKEFREKNKCNQKTINNDLDYVASRFEDVGLFDIATKIKNKKKN